MSILITLLVIMATVVLAVSGERSVEVPFLVGAQSGSGADILALQVNPLGVVLWLVGLTVILGLPVALTRRRTA